KVEQALGSKIEPLVLDLYRIALVVYVWDIRSDRTHPPRHFRALISVSNKDKWDGARSHLEATLGFITGDVFSFNFVQNNGSGERARFRLNPQQANSCVLLFS